MPDTKNTVVRFSEEDFNKVKYILWFENQGVSQNTFITDAVKSAIDKWEKENKPITDKLMKDARIK